MRKLLFIYVLSYALGAFSLPKFISSNKNILAYLKNSHPELHKAIENDYYDELAEFSPLLLLGSDILLEFPSHTSLHQAQLIAARWHEDAFKDQAYNFSYADLSFAWMDTADLRKSDLTNTKFHYARLRNAIFSCSSIRGADFSFADIKNVRIKINNNIFYVSQNLLKLCGAKFNSNTKIKNPLRRTFRSRFEWDLILDPNDN
jgi:uncharacterized protein YjbI with pentapeptide repeats